ncbi:MAG: YdeI/OmpD-associated family protein [Anaerolineae bacterium]|nr:YdeI/OmpD-associated family protein [Anaerolineae bacterium]MDW8172843.1 YdeI/OmpD-associated family protein [Anaerolineae bacterium]
MDITETVYVPDRSSWRAWLAENHAHKQEIWLLYPTKASGKPRVAYIDAVEEALCFGWIDGLTKSYDAETQAQRFTPRRPKSNWTELNKERARRLIAAGLMTDAGSAVLPDLTLKPLEIAPDVLAALQADPQVWANWQGFDELYQRIRVGYVEEQRRNRAEFQRRLANLVAKTRQNKRFGTIT